MKRRECEYEEEDSFELGREEEGSEVLGEVSDQSEHGLEQPSECVCLLCTECPNPLSPIGVRGSRCIAREEAE